MSQAVPTVRGWLWVTALLLAGCDARTAPLTQPVALTDYGFSLRFPADWQVRENDASLRLLARPLRGGQPVSGVWFIVSRDRARPPSGDLPTSAPNLASYVERREALARKDTIDYRLVATGALRLDGLVAVLNERAYASYSSRSRSWVALTVRQQCGYELIGTAAAADYRDWRPSFAAIVDSLRWLPAPADCATTK